MMLTTRPRSIASQPKLLACALACCLAIGAMPALAQSTGATLRGTADGGAEITATNTETGLVRRVTATERRQLHADESAARHLHRRSRGRHHAER